MAEMLISKMQGSLKIDFDQDGILLKGLLNHLGPMTDRIKGNVQLHDDVSQFIPEKYQYVYIALKEILKTDLLLMHLTENEEIYLAIYFIGSLRRMQKKFLYECSLDLWIWIRNDVSGKRCFIE